jgi:hypothetical protein
MLSDYYIHHKQKLNSFLKCVLIDCGKFPELTVIIFLHHNNLWIFVLEMHFTSTDVDNEFLYMPVIYVNYMYLWINSHSFLFHLLRSAKDVLH